MSNVVINGNVTSAAALNLAINQAAGESAPGTYEIDLGSNIQLTTALAAIQLQPGVTLDIEGNGFTLDGGGQRGLFVYSGTVDVDNLSIENARATGSSGASGGGGGAGLGGGLFVGSGSNVTLANVTFAGDSAVGGNGSISGPIMSGGGYGNGGGFNGSGGGVGSSQTGGAGGFGSGGGAGGVKGGEGGFGGGGGGFAPASGGFGGGIGGESVVNNPPLTFTVVGVGVETVPGGSSDRPAGGGGLGAGGDIFVQQGGTLTIENGSLSGGSVAGGAAGGSAGAGKSYGSGIFIQGNQTVSFAPGSGQTLIIADVIADMTGSHDPSGQTGTGSVSVNGPGTLQLEAANTYTGTTTINSGKLELAAGALPGTGAIIFGGPAATLQVDATVTGVQNFSNTLEDLAPGDEIDLPNLKLAAGQSFPIPPTSTTLEVQGTGGTEVFTLLNPASTQFTARNDGSGGTLVTMGSSVVDPGPTVNDATTAGEKVAHGSTVAVGTATPGLAGDTLSLTQLSGPVGAVTLSNGIVSFAAPAHASGPVAFSYRISDQLGDLSAVISDTLAVDPGPSVTDTTTPGEEIAHGSTGAVGTATPGLAGDTLSLTQLSGPVGAVTLSSGIVSFAAPANASGPVAFSYRISDQLGDLSAVISDSLAVDPGPSVTDTTTAGEKVAHGTTVAVGTATPGLPGDTLSLTQLSGPVGAVTLSNGIVSFAGANVSGNVAFSYQISDQLGDVSAVISDTLAVDPGPGIVVINGNVTSAAALNLAINQAAGESAPGTYEIDLGSNIQLTTALAAIQLQPGVTLDIEGNGFTLDGGGQRGLFVYSGTVDVDNLSIENARATGSSGASGGGGGAGLGGGLFVGSGSNVTLANVTFAGDSAVGGNGSISGPIMSGGGYGNGGGFNGSGGGVGSSQTGGAGGFGSGGGAGGVKGGEGGFGGGGGGFAPASGGFGGGIGGESVVNNPPLTFTVVGVGVETVPGGSSDRPAGGGGLGAGGDIFVQQGGTLTIENGSLSGGSVAGGAAGGSAGAGKSYGSGIFIQGNQTVSFAPGSGQTLIIADVIADMTGSHDPSGQTGTGSVSVNGPGTLQLEAANTYTGTTTINSGKLELAAGALPGTGAIIFGGPAATLQVDATVTGVQNFSNTLEDLAPGDEIDLPNLKLAAGQSFPIPPTSTTLEVQGTGGTEVFTLLNPASTQFTARNDGSGGTLVTMGSSVVDPGPTVNDATTAGEKVAHGSTVAVGTATPGLAGDTLSLTQLSGPVGAVTLSNGIVSFAAPANASGPVAFSYRISDQLGDLSAVISDTLAVDPGPSVTDTTTPGEEIAHGTTVAVGTATPGLPGDTLGLTELSGPPGAVTLSNGIVSFAAPANASGPVAFSYRISDQLGDLSAVISDTLAVDLGPSVTDTTTAGEKVAHGTTVAVGTATPGLPGDTLSLTQLSGPVGAVTLSNGIVSFAGANVSGNVAFSYQISDQLGDVSAVISDTVAVDPGPSVTDTTTAGEKVAHGSTVAVGTATPGLAGDTLSLTQLSGPIGAVTLSGGIVSFAAPANASGNVAFSYKISDQLGDVSAVISDTLAVDPGPTIASVTPAVVEKGQSTEIGTVAAGLAGDTLTLKQTGGGGALALKLVGGVEEVIYTAPVTVAASTLDAVSYTVTDQLGGTATGSASVQLDAGPTIASVTPAVVEKGQSTEIGTVAAGLAGDTLSLTKTGGGALALKLVGGVEEVIYTAPVTVAASTLDAVSYTVTDQLGGTATGSASVQLDAGPTIASVTPAVVEKGQSTEIGTVAAGLAGDTLTLKQTGGGGALALKLVGGVEEVIYTAPVTVAASTLDAVSYTVTDQLGGTATGSASVQLDAGPTIASVTPAVVEKGQSTEIGTVAAGLAGDMLTLKQTGGGGALALKLVGSVEEVIYTAPVTVAASTLDAVSYTVTDQLGGTATGSSTIPVASGTSSIIVGTAGHAVSAGNNNSVIDGRAGNETIQAGNGTDVVFAGPNDTIQAGNGNDVVLGGSSDKISLGNGNDTVNAGAGSSVSAGNGNDTITAGGNVTLGNGNDTVTSTGANSKITLGNGVDVVYAAANDTISLGNGNDTVYAGANDTISLGKGADTVAFGVGSSPAAFGNETVNSFSVHSDQIDLSLAQFLSYAAMMSNHEITSSGANTIITDGHGDNVTLTGVAPSSLSASNFRFS